MYYLHTFSCTSLTNLRDLDRESFEYENKIQKKPSFFGSSSVPIGLARRADSATQSQFSVHFSTKTSDFFRSEFCGVLIRSRCEVVCVGVGIRSFSQSIATVRAHVLTLTQFYSVGLSQSEISLLDSIIN